MLLLTGCADDYVPRPTGYIRFSFPEKQYENFSAPFGSFEKPTYMILKPKESPKGEFWFDLLYPRYGVSIHVSYKPIQKNLFQLLEDTHYYVYKHTVKATAIEEQLVTFPGKRVYSTIYQLRGNVATNVQFSVTDSTQHFIRGSLYIQGRPNEDSLKPIIDFARQDIEQMIRTLAWK